MARAKKSTRSRSTRDDSRRTPDAIALLKADHRQVEDWFSQFEKARDDDRKQRLATQICNALKVHTTIEEEIAKLVAEIPLGRMGKPEEFANVAAFLLSPAAAYVHGAAMPVDGGIIKGTF